MATQLKSDSLHILNHVSTQFSHELKPMMVNYFDSLDKLLVELAEKTDSDSKKKHYYESMRSIKTHKLNVLVSFLSSIHNVVKLFANKHFDYAQELYLHQHNSAINFSINADDIDEKRIQNGLIEKFDNQYLPQLDLIRAYFSTLMQTEMQPQHNPLGTLVLVSAFAKSIRLLHLNQNIKVILYKHYELNILNKTQQLYQQCLNYLSSKLAQTSVNIQQKLTATHTITKAEISTVLTDLQKKFQRDNNATPHKVKTALMSALEHIQLIKSHHINNHDLYAIDYVTMRFQLIAEDKNIEPAIKHIIEQLHIPYLKYLTDDESFIEDKNHPAQLLLNTIQACSVGWDNQLESGQLFRSKLKDMVAIINQASNLNETLLRVIQTDLQAFMAQQQEEIAKEQQRIANREQGKAKIAAAMKAVDALIQLKTENASLPAFVKDILYGPWKNLLSLLLVRYSDTSAEYLRMVVFIDDLLALLKSDQYDVIIQDNISKLAEIYQQGLQLVAYGGDVLTGKVNKFTDKLMQHHALGIYAKDTNLTVKHDNPNNIETSRHQTISRHLKNQQNPKPNKATSHLQNFNKQDSLLLATVPIGAWVDIPRFHKEPVKAKLSWINPASGKYIFVNARGLKVTDRTPEQLLADLKDGQITLSKSLI